MKTTQDFFRQDSHTFVIWAGMLTKSEKEKLGIDPDLYATFNEVGFSYPEGEGAWDKDCFNVLVCENDRFDDADVMLFDISDLPKRLKSTYNKVVKERNLTNNIL